MGHVTHINKHCGNTIKRGDTDVLSEDQMVVLQEALSIDNLKSWSTSQVFLTLNIINLDIFMNVKYIITAKNYYYCKNLGLRLPKALYSNYIFVY